jgi:ribonuclease P/MRP protein subunit POP5
MVRIKHRYLLVDILYPEYSKSFSSSSSTPRHLKFHQPTADTLTPGLFSKLLRDTVSDLFGDYGVGKLGGASSGNLISTSSFSTFLSVPCKFFFF